MIRERLDLQVRRGGYAFISDNVMLEYYTKQAPCNTIQTVGRLFASSGYGIGLAKNSPYADELSMHILQMRENGNFDRLFTKWYQLKWNF